MFCPDCETTLMVRRDFDIAVLDNGIEYEASYDTYWCDRCQCQVESPLEDLPDTGLHDNDIDEWFASLESGK